jgi:Holliday junction resolvase RusA-like endonuclease
MRPMMFSMPFLPPSLNVYRKEHWRRQREEEKTWKDFIAVKWAELGRPKLKAVRIAVTFSFPDRKTRDLDNYLATGSKLVGDAVKGRFIPDDGPEHLMAWSFQFEFGDEAKTTVVIEEAGRGGAGDQVTLWEDLPTQKKAAGRADDAATGCVDGRGAAVCPSDAEGSISDTRPDCALYETCLAPLCPLDRSSLSGVWYPGEEICRSRTQGNSPWLKRQRKIAGCGAGAGRYFTLAMLSRDCIIRRGITGLDPNEEEEPQLRVWMKDHPERKALSDCERAELEKRMEKCRDRRSGKAARKHPREEGVRPRF